MFTKKELDELEFMLNNAIDENERTIEFSKEEAMKKALCGQKEVFESIREKVRKM